MDYYNAGERATALYNGRLGPWAQDRYMPFVRDKYDLDPDKLPFDFDEIIASLAPRPFFSNSPLHTGTFPSRVCVRELTCKQVYSFMDAADNIK